VKRMHVHVAVDDLQSSIGFYSALFDAQPSVIKGDYAKWMLPQFVRHCGASVAWARPRSVREHWRAISDTAQHRFAPRRPHFQCTSLSACRARSGAPTPFRSARWR
jgi:hypothetical protein